MRGIGRVAKGWHIRVTCSQCGRELAGINPKDGDGSTRRVLKHKTPSGSWCDGHLHTDHEWRKS